MLINFVREISADDKLLFMINVASWCPGKSIRAFTIQKSRKKLRLKDRLKSEKLKSSEETSKQRTMSWIKPLLLYFPFTFDFILQISDVSSRASRYDLFVTRLLLLREASSLSRLFSQPLSQFFHSQLDKRCKFTILWIRQRSTITSSCIVLLFFIYTLWDFFHFHFVFNSPREETRFLSYSYVAGDRMKTLFWLNCAQLNKLLSDWSWTKKNKKVW